MEPAAQKAAAVRSAPRSALVRPGQHPSSLPAAVQAEGRGSEQGGASCTAAPEQASTDVQDGSRAASAVAARRWRAPLQPLPGIQGRAAAPDGSTVQGAQAPLRLCEGAPAHSALAAGAPARCSSWAGPKTCAAGAHRLGARAATGAALMPPAGAAAAGAGGRSEWACNPWEASQAPGPGHARSPGAPASGTSGRAAPPARPEWDDTVAAPATGRRRDPACHARSPTPARGPQAILADALRRREALQRRALAAAQRDGGAARDPEPAPALGPGDPARWRGAWLARWRPLQGSGLQDAPGPGSDAASGDEDGVRLQDPARERRAAVAPRRAPAHDALEWLDAAGLHAAGRAGCADKRAAAQGPCPGSGSANLGRSASGSPRAHAPETDTDTEQPGPAHRCARVQTAAAAAACTKTRVSYAAQRDAAAQAQMRSAGLSSDGTGAPSAGEEAPPALGGGAAAQAGPSPARVDEAATGSGAAASHAGQPCSPQARPMTDAGAGAHAGACLADWRQAGAGAPVHDMGQATSAASQRDPSAGAVSGAAVSCAAGRGEHGPLAAAGEHGRPAHETAPAGPEGMRLHAPLCHPLTVLCPLLCQLEPITTSGSL